MDSDTQQRLDRLERQQARIIAFCDGLLNLAMPTIPRLVRPVIRGLADRLHQDEE